MAYGRRGRKRLVDGVESDFVGFYLPRPLREKLTDEAEDKRISVSHMMRAIICDFFEEDHLDGDIKRANHATSNA